MEAPDWKNVCAYCHVLPRHQHDKILSFGFCIDADCSADRIVNDAIFNQENIKVHLSSRKEILIKRKMLLGWQSKQWFINKTI